ncbi:MAG: hypothetical protein SA339_06620 [Methanomassiliicoccus sp.]|nr:hypothetical protein [Methanomassiliicoccus sp.]
MEMRERMERKVEEKPKLDEEELKLREQTLKDTPSDTDRPKTESGIYAPEGEGQGMAPADQPKEGDVGEKKEGTAKRMSSGDLGGR